MGLRSLVMGFGGSGSYILTAIKQIAVIKHGKKPEELQFLELDTLAPEVFDPSKYIEGDQDINEDFLIDDYSEYYHLKDQKPDFSQHIDRHVAHPVDDQYEIFENWLHSEWMGEHLPEKQQNIRTGAGQHRQIGRYAAFRNAKDIRDRIEEKLIQAANGDALVPVWLIGSAAGGTGAGTMIDAAFITRAASQNASVNIELAGVVVLPSVYDDIPGIDDARVHSFFRELERFQTATGDKFLSNGTKIASFVKYRNFRSNVSSELFDNLIYVGQQCTTEAQRRSFFTSVGNAIEPYMDAEAGTDLLEATANDTRAYSSFGATRLYVPEETYADLFAQEQLRDYLDAVVPSAEESEGVEAGDPGGRKSAAEDRVEDLLNFDDLLARKDWSDRRYRQFVETLSPEEIVTGWCQFNNITTSREKQISARLAYANPLYSLTEPDPSKVDDEGIRLQTYNELRNTGGDETQEDSRDRFYRKLGRIKDTYTSAEGGPNTFKRGGREFHEVVTDYLFSEVDEDIIGDLSGPVTDPDATGTPLTRLYEELKHVTAQSGPLATIDGVLENMIEVAEEKAREAEEKYNDERELLKNAAPSGLFGSWSTWVDVPQQESRDMATDYFVWYQKRELLQTLRHIVQEVRGRYEAWHDQVKSVVDAFALGEQPMKYVTDAEIKSLEGRLYQMTQQGTAMISLEEDDVSMQGYRDELRDEAVVDRDGSSLASKKLTVSEWEASVEDSQPVLKLVVGDGTTARSTDASESLTREFRQALLGAFRDRIDGRLAKRDVFDYLRHVIENEDLDTGNVAARLEDTSTPLLEGGGTTDFLFVHTSLRDPEKAGLAKEIRDEFTQDAEHLEHSDENALTLVQVKKPGPDDVTPELKSYKSSYINRITQGPQGGDAFTRAQVYHPFRPELEAWFIERYFQREDPKGAEKYYLPPRVVRLLEYPRMMQAFVYCLAAGAIEETSHEMGESVWVWYNTERDMECELTDPAVEGHDLIQAATTFVLRQQPLNYTIDIYADTARQSALVKAEEQGRSLEEMVQTFVQEERVRQFIDKHTDPEKSSEEDRQGLARVFQFYGRWGARHGLHNRTL